MSGKNLSRSIRTEPNNTNLPHNNREEDEVNKKESGHIDKSRIKDNVYLKQEPIEEKYEEIFGEAQEKYNDKQRRKDRKIDNYYEQVKDSKTTYVQREMIVQFGSVEDIESGKFKPEELKEMLEEYYEDFQERNPNLQVYNAVIHMDEATPHMHLNFIPVGTDYKRGMEKQVAFNRALSQQNESFNKTRPFEDWRDSEIEVMDSIMASRDIEIKEVGANHKHMSHDRYKEVKEREKVVAKREEKSDERDKKLVSQINKANEDINEKSQSLKSYEEELKKKDKKQTAKLRSLNSKEKRLNSKESSLLDKSKSLKEDKKALEGSKNDFEAYVTEKEEEFEDKGAKLADRAQNIDDRELLVGERENSVKKEEEGLKGLKSDLEDREEKVGLKEDNASKKLLEAMRLIEIAEKLVETYEKVSEKIKKGFVRPEELIEVEEKTKRELNPYDAGNPEHLETMDEAISSLKGFSDDDLKDLVEDDSKQL